MLRARFLFATTLTLLATAAESQTLFGARVGAYTEQEDLFVGGEVLTPLGSGFYLNPNVEWVFADRAKQATFNFDLHYDFATRSFATFWVGGGLGILYYEPDGPAEGSTDAGANALFGVAFRQGGVIPYVQAKLILSDDTEFVAGFGIRF